MEKQWLSQCLQHITVKALCEEHGMPFEEMQRWYDGYFFEAVGHVYSPNSVIEAVDSGEVGNYWSRTETYESLMMYIAMDFDGLRQLIVDLLSDQRRGIDVESFQNVKEYQGNILLVGISYGKKNRRHQCRIEKFEM